MVTVIEKQITVLKKTTKRIDTDILKKQKTLFVEESCINVDLGSTSRREIEKKKKRRYITFASHVWEINDSNFDIAMKSQ